MDSLYSFVVRQNLMAPDLHRYELRTPMPQCKTVAASSSEEAITAAVRLMKL